MTSPSTTRNWCPGYMKMSAQPDSPVNISCDNSSPSNRLLFWPAACSNNRTAVVPTEMILLPSRLATLMVRAASLSSRYHSGREQDRWSESRFCHWGILCPRSWRPFHDISHIINRICIFKRDEHGQSIIFTYKY